MNHWDAEIDPFATIGFARYARAMAKIAKPPISPTVAAIFESFIGELKTNGAEAIVVEKLQAALSTQELDPESLRKALFTPPAKPK